MYRATATRTPRTRITTGLPSEMSRQDTSAAADALGAVARSRRTRTRFQCVTRTRLPPLSLSAFTGVTVVRNSGEHESPLTELTHDRLRVGTKIQVGAPPLLTRMDSGTGDDTSHDACRGGRSPQPVISVDASPAMLSIPVSATCLEGDSRRSGMTRHPTSDPQVAPHPDRLPMGEAGRPGDAELELVDGVACVRQPGEH